jgi:pimeloyl-ACP methyl ester carboxylesterase
LRNAAEPSDEDVEPTKIKIKTTLGDLEAWEFGTAGAPLALAIHGLSNSDLIHREWFHAAKALAKDGYHVLVPNLHSCTACMPGRVGPEKREAQLLEIMDSTGSDKIAVLLGKSHGGAIAARFAAAQPSKVEKVVLAAPALARTDDLQIPQSTMLLWARDDPSFARAQEVSKALQKEHHYIANFGGHAVLEEYSDQVLGFLHGKQDSQHRC